MTSTNGGTPEHRIDAYRAMLQPGGGLDAFESLRARDSTSKRRLVIYRVVSLINAAMRSRASAQKRSTERSDVDNASAVSAVVKPAK